MILKDSSTLQSLLIVDISAVYVSGSSSSPKHRDFTNSKINEDKRDTFGQQLQVVEILESWRLFLLLVFWGFSLVCRPLQVEFQMHFNPRGQEIVHHHKTNVFLVCLNSEYIFMNRIEIHLCWKFSGCGNWILTRMRTKWAPILELLRTLSQ